MDGWIEVDGYHCYMSHADQPEYGAMVQIVQTLRTSLVRGLRFLPAGEVNLISGWGTGVLAEGDA